MPLAETKSEQALVTILAVDTVDSTLLIRDREPDDAKEALDAIMAHVDRAVTRHGGMLASFNGDGGLAVFGWPASRENHADLAYAAAAAIVAPAELPAPSGWGQPFSPRLRAGIHSGLVGFRELELAPGARLDLVGAVVHIAARLQKAAAPGSILISSATAKLMRKKIEMSRGEAGPVGDLVDGPVYSAPLALREETAAVAPELASQGFVGRHRELAKLLAAHVRPRENPLLAGIVGEPGIGKSRLLGEFAAALKAGNSRLSVHFAKGDSLAQASPYQLMAQLLRSAIEARGAPGEKSLVERIAASGLTTEEQSAAISVIAPESDERQRTWSPALLQQSLVDAFFKIDPSASGLVVIDDFHLADRESRDCVRRAAAAARPQWSMALASRPEAGAELEESCGLMLPLRPLSGDEMAELAARLCEREGMAPSKVANAVVRADGVPFILEQIVATIKAGASEAELKLPQGVHSLVHARLQLVSRQAKRLAQSLSLLGGQADLQVIGFMMRDVAPDISGPMDELEALSILEPRQAGRAAIRHAIIADACATTISRGLRRDIHRLAVEAIEKHASLKAAQLERLAYHAEAAGDEQKALDYLWQAAHFARRTFALGSLSAIFANAVRLAAGPGAGDAVRYVDFVLMACTALLQGGEFALMKEHLPEAAKLAEAQTRPVKVSAALASMATIDWFEGRYRDAEANARRALAIARGASHLPLVFAAQMALANALHGQGRVAEAIGLAREMCSMLAGDLERQRLGAGAAASLIARSFLSWYLLDTGEFAEAKAQATRALAVAQETGDEFAQALALSSLGSSLLALGDASAIDTLSSALDLAIRKELEAIVPSLVGRLAVSYARAGAVPQAIRLIATHDKPQALQRTGKAELFYFQCGKGEALCVGGQTDAGMAAIGDAIQVARSIGAPGLLARGLAAKSRTAAPTEPINREELAEYESLCVAHGLRLA